MSKVVLFNLYEFSYLGTRCLAAWLRKNGVDTHNILYEEYRLLRVEKPLDKDFLGYHMYMNGAVYETPATQSTFSELDYANIEKLIADEKPDIVGFSTRSTHNCLVPLLAPVLKKSAPNALLVAGGYGPTLDPDIYLDAGFDVVVRGDGEEPLLSLVQAWDAQDRAALTAIPATYWSKNWGGARNSLMDQKKNLSEYPGPLFGHEFFSCILDGQIHKNTDPVLFKKLYYTYFGKGCIGTCSYCSGGQWGNLYRQEGKKAYKRRNRNIDDVMDELKRLPKESIDTIIFCDEYWGNSKALTREFFTRYKEEVGLPFWAYMPYEQMVNDPTLFDLALDAGLVATGIGFQTGSYDFARKYYLRKQNYPLLLTYAHMLFQNKILINPQFIGGNCYETMEDFMLTVDVVRRLPFSIESPFSVQLQSTQLRAHPHSPLRELAPRVVTEPMPTVEWYYRAILLELARLVDKDEFEAILKKKRYRQKPWELQKIFDFLLFKKQYEHFRKVVDTERDKQWVFFGGGHGYEMNKNFFAPLEPRAMLIDEQFQTGVNKIDNLPVFSPEEFFQGQNPEDVNVLVFINTPWRILKRLLRQYKIPPENLHSCSSDWSSPFCAERIEQMLGHA